MSVQPITQEEYAEFARYLGLIYATPGFTKPFYNPPVLEGTTVVFTSRYRNDWGYDQYLFMEYTEQGYQLVTQGEFRNHPEEQSRQEIFSRFDWAGHYILREQGDRARRALKKNPLNWMFLDKPLAEGFASEKTGKYRNKVWLIDDPDSYFITSSGGRVISQYINLSYERIYDLLLHQETELPPIKK